MDIPQQKKKRTNKGEKTDFFAILFFFLFKLQARSEKTWTMAAVVTASGLDGIKKKVTLPVSGHSARPDHRIKRTEMIADYCDGGQKMLDIMEFNKSLKIAWILKYISDECKSK